MTDWIKLLLVGAVLAAQVSNAEVVWRGDFETGDRSQWAGVQMVHPDRLEVVQTPAREGRYALKTVVRQGDDPIGASGNRNELVRMTLEDEGDEYFYRWSTQFGRDFPSSSGWQLFTQWHHTGPNGSPPVEFLVRADKVVLCVRAEGAEPVVYWSAPLERGRWYDFIFHARWSSQKDLGFIELYVDGIKVVPRQQVATLFRGQRNYLKQGLYRQAGIKPEGVVIHDGMIQATLLSDVLDPSVPSFEIARGEPGLPGTAARTPEQDEASELSPPANQDGPFEATGPGNPEQAIGYGCSTGPNALAATAASLLVLFFLARRRRVPCSSRARR